jgi:hypothetical protein
MCLIRYIIPYLLQLSLKENNGEQFVGQMEDGKVAAKCSHPYIALLDSLCRTR